LAVPVVQWATARGHPHRLVLIDYAAETHPTLGGLIATVCQLVRDSAGGEPCVAWGQSFGNLLAVRAADQPGVQAAKLVLVSPFTDLPQARVLAGMVSLSLSPRWLYRLTIGPAGRAIFGPVGEQGDGPFIASLRGADPRAIGRRVGWLRSRRYARYFTNVTAPTRVWLGRDDRLLDLSKQRAFFAGLARSRANYSLSMVGGAGHVMLPRRVVRCVSDELRQWLMEGDL
jgi:pimeloyl-ACP methyl ester carboxylesterase